jgi:predicted nucleic acid-binding protein
MRIYFDTSAVVPLLLDEERSIAARKIWATCEEAWAWEWLTIETEAALVRQKGNRDAWALWRQVSNAFTLCELASAHIAQLRAFNRTLGLRAADAAHLFLFDRLVTRLPDLQLLTFDREMAQAADTLALPLHRGSVG